MHRLSRLLVASLLTLGCILIWMRSIPAATLSNPPSNSLFHSLPQTDSLTVAQSATPSLDLGRHFKDLNVEGSILIENLDGDRVYQHNPTRNATGFLPASTFKILNSLISLETGVIHDEVAVLTWDGISRMIPEWNRDLNMREAFRLSAVWFYQVLARRVGYDRMQQWITKVGYGNQNIGDRENIDQFWLNGKFAITPKAQVQFLRRLYQNDLPFSERSISITKDIMIVEKTPDYTISAKSGWAGLGEPGQPQIGWYVGYLTKGAEVYLFATNIDIRTDQDPGKRVELTRRSFKDLGLL